MNHAAFVAENFGVNVSENDWKHLLNQIKIEIWGKQIMFIVFKAINIFWWECFRHKCIQMWWGACHSDRELRSNSNAFAGLWGWNFALKFDSGVWHKICCWSSCENAFEFERFCRVMRVRFLTKVKICYWSSSEMRSNSNVFAGLWG